MASCAIRLLLFLSILSCANDDLDSATRAAVAAATLCQKPAHDMVWLETLLKQSQSDATLHGDLYAVSVDGNRIELSTIDQQKVVEGMQPVNRIYTAFEAK